MVASSEQVKDFQGVVPQTSIIPTGNVDYFRTSWNGMIGPHSGRLYGRVLQFGL